MILSRLRIFYWHIHQNMNMFYISLNDNAMILLFITSKMTRIYTLRTTPHQAVTFVYFYRYIEDFFFVFFCISRICILINAIWVFVDFLLKRWKQFIFVLSFLKKKIFVLFQCTLKLETSSYLPSLCRSSSFTFRACSNAVLETNIKNFF